MVLIELCVLSLWRKLMYNKLMLCITCILLTYVCSATADIGELNASEDQDFQGLDDDIQVLKEEVLELNRDLYILEEELLYPSSTQVAVYVSVDVGDFFDLDSVQVTLNEKVVANYLYTEREVDALLRGGVHQIYIGNLPSGEHELVAYFVGKGPKGRDFKRGANRIIDKGLGAKYLELKITDRTPKHQPDFVVKEWE
jgi:hypothetical protein